MHKNSVTEEPCKNIKCGKILVDEEKGRSLTKETMEKKKENEGIDHLMEKYNFDSPVEVTLVIDEEEDPPEPVLLEDQLVSNKTKVLNSNICSNSKAVDKRKDSNIDNAKNNMPMAKKNRNSISSVKDNNRSISVIQTVIPEELLEKTQDTQWQLLDDVADNLIHITKCYYHNFVTSENRMKDYEKLTLVYKNYKHIFFNLSYSTTIAVLLPQENDQLFLNTFIHRVIKISHRYSWYQISYEILESLIREMLIWTKQRRQSLDIIFGSHKHKRDGIHCSSSALTISNIFNSKQILNRPFDNGPTTNSATQETNSNPDNVPKTHLPVQVTNISPDIRHITNYLKQALTRQFNISPRTNNPVQDIDNQANVGQIKNKTTPKRTKRTIAKKNCSKTFHSQPEINTSHSFDQRTNHSNQGTSSPFNIERIIDNSTQVINRFSYNGSRILHSTEAITSIYNNESETNNFSTCQAMNTNSSKILLSTGPPNHENTISEDSEIYSNINHQNKKQLNNATECHVNEVYGAQSMKRRKTNNSSKNVSRANDNNFDYKKNTCSAKTFKPPVESLYEDDSIKIEYELFNTDTLRSSISRDSGFGSPICGSFRSEQTIETSTNEEQRTPIITYVTSMNPDAVPLNVGCCKVCGVTTNNMCIGCYQKYYCSFLCQKKDWENHKYLCSR